MWIKMKLKCYSEWDTKRHENTAAVDWCHGNQSIKKYLEPLSTRHCQFIAKHVVHSSRILAQESSFRSWRSHWSMLPAWNCGDNSSPQNECEVQPERVNWKQSAKNAKFAGGKWFSERPSHCACWGLLVGSFDQVARRILNLSYHPFLLRSWRPRVVDDVGNRVW